MGAKKVANYFLQQLNNNTNGQRRQIIRQRISPRLGSTIGTTLALVSWLAKAFTRLWNRWTIFQPYC